MTATIVPGPGVRRGQGPESLIPHNIEAEQGLLGALLLNNDLHDHIAGLDASHFYDPVHADIYQAATDLIRTDKLASPVTLKTTLAEHPGLAELGGVAYLARVAAASITCHPTVIRQFAELIIDHHRRRQITYLCTDLSTAVRTGMDVQEALSGFEEALTEIEDDGPASGTISLAAALDAAMARWNDAYQGGDAIGLDLRIPELTSRISKIRPGDMVLLAGRPSMGKSALALEMARRVALAGDAVVYWCGEMTPADNAERAVSAQTWDAGTEIAYHDGARGRMSPDAFRAALEAARSLEDVPFVFVDAKINQTARLGREIRKNVRKFRKKGREHILVVLDYVQKIDAGARNRFEQVTEASSWCKNIGMELDCCTLVLSQLSRKAEERDDKRPRLSDLRETGQLEQDANIVLTCYRDEYYLEREINHIADANQKSVAIQSLEAARGWVEISGLKVRGGPIFTTEIAFDLATNSLRSKTAQAADQENLW